MNILILIVGLSILLTSCMFEPNFVVTVWWEIESCDSTLCTEGRMFYSWSEAQAFCSAKNLECSYVDTNE